MITKFDLNTCKVLTVNWFSGLSKHSSPESMRAWVLST